MTSLYDKQVPIWLMISFFVFVVIASIADIAIDISHNSNLAHLVQESIILFLAIIILFRIFTVIIQQRKLNLQLQAEIVKKDLQYSKISEELVKAKRNFGEMITKQFTDWNLTQSEADVSWLILKGLNSKEIAQIRNLSEKTVRNQLSSVYKKSGLRGKQHLIAWFMDDLL